jgi:hypothetical protein
MPNLSPLFSPWGVEFMPPKGYTSISVPTKLVALIRQIIQNPNLPYTTVSDFAKQALREKIERNE